MPQIEQIPTLNRLLNLLIDKGLAFVIMGAALWTMYSWVEDGRLKQDEEIKGLKKLVEACALEKKDRLETQVNTIESKVDRLLNLKLNDNGK